MRKIETEKEKRLGRRKKREGERKKGGGVCGRDGKEGMNKGEQRIGDLF